jgi:hypothetical protein
MLEAPKPLLTASPASRAKKKINLPLLRTRGPSMKGSFTRKTNMSGRSILAWSYAIDYLEVLSHH